RDEEAERQEGEGERHLPARRAPPLEADMEAGHGLRRRRTMAAPSAAVARRAVTTSRASATVELPVGRAGTAAGPGDALAAGDGAGSRPPCGGGPSQSDGSGPLGAGCGPKTWGAGAPTERSHASPNPAGPTPSASVKAWSGPLLTKPATRVAIRAWPYVRSM